MPHCRRHALRSEFARVALRGPARQRSEHDADRFGGRICPAERARRARVVPKKDLVTCLVGLLEERRLKVAREVTETRKLVNELLNFKLQITPAANVVYGAWRSGQHDDPVLAVSLACWWAEGRKLQAASAT
jgi:hypothetical protein